MTKVKKSSLTSKFMGLSVASFFALTGVLYMLFSSAATPGTPAFGLYLSPSSSSVTTGSQINVKVYANLNGTTGINSITAYLHYDPTQLHIVSADQEGSPSYPVKTWCTKLEGCKPEGDAVFTAGYSGTGNIAPADGILIGNLGFKALKTGTASLTFDTNPQLSGFSSTTVSAQTLASRQLMNGSYAVTTPSTGGGGTTNPNTNGGGTSTNTGGNTTKTTTTTKSTTGNTPGNSTTAGSNSTSAGTNAPTTTDSNNQPVAVGNTSNDQNSGGGSGSASTSAVPQKSASKALILAASMAVSAIVVGILALLFSEPVRNKIALIFHHGGSQFVQPNDPLVMGGPGSTVVTPPHTINSSSQPSENIVIHPTNPTAGSNNDTPSSLHSSSHVADTTSSGTTVTQASEDPEDNLMKPSQPSV